MTFKNIQEGDPKGCLPSSVSHALARRTLQGLIYLNLFFLESYLIRFHIGSYPTNLQEVSILVLAIIFLGITIAENGGKKFIKAVLSHKIINILIILTAISLMIVKPINLLDQIRHVKFLAFGSVLTIIFLETFKTSEERKYALKIAGAGAILFGLFSVIYNLAGFNVAYDLRLLGPLDAAVYLAYYLTPFFLLFSIDFINNPKNKINLVSAVILGILIIATMSMGAILGSFLVLVFYLIKKNKILRTKLPKMILALIGIIVVSTVFYVKILPTIRTNYSSLSERGQIWKVSASFLKDPENILLGLGFGQFQENYLRAADKVLGQKPLDYYVLQPHNIFLLFIFQYGILGLLFIVVCLYKTLKKCLVSEKFPETETIFAFILLYFFLHGMIDTPFFKNDIIILFLIFMELGLGLGKNQEHAQSPSSTSITP
ncbi:O-antigen ligase family protein [Candidatus Peregrinibacteria bacterium]|nr:O-antigen ligase family protein [Candidatus Peregrinibacteria bacterium]